MLEEMATLLSRDFCDQMCFSFYGIIANICKLELIYVLHNSFYRFNFILIYRGSTLDHSGIVISKWRLVYQPWRFNFWLGRIFSKKVGLTIFSQQTNIIWV